MRGGGSGAKLRYWMQGELLTSEPLLFSCTSQPKKVLVYISPIMYTRKAYKFMRFS